MKTQNQSVIARELGISRAAVSKLIKNRERTGFPMPDKDGHYDTDTVAKWYINFDPKKGPKAGIRATEK